MLTYPSFLFSTQVGPRDATMVTATKDAAKNEIASLSAKSAKLKHEGDVHFGKKNLTEAHLCYEKALALSLSGSDERAALHSNRAACYLMENKFQKAISEATAALDTAPNFKPALMRRAKAMENIGLHTKAASDYERAFKLDGNEETRRKMSTAKANAAVRKKGGAAGLGAGLGARRPAARRLTPAQQQAEAVARQQQQQKQMPTLTLNVTFEGQLKQFTVPLSVTYTQILDAVKKSFFTDDKTQAVALKYKDPEETLVTVTSRADLRNALASSVSAVERNAAATGKPSGIAPGGLVPVELEVVKTTSTPTETPDQVTPANVGSAEHAPEDDEKAEDVIEIDEWLLTFASLFRKHLGEAGETTGPLDLRAVGLEKCCEALEEAVGTDQAKELLGSAAEKFQEAAAAAVFNWGNVHVCASRKLVDTSEPHASGSSVEQNAPSEAALKMAATKHMKRIDEEYTKAVEKYVQSLAIKTDFYEASIAWGQQAFERGKVLHVASKDGDGKLAAEADTMFVLAESKFQESLLMIPKDEASTSGDAPPAPEEGLSLKSQILVLWGNVLFERSQVKHHRDASGDWEKDCTLAITKFTDAGCVRNDIVRALMNHTSGIWKDEKDAEAAAGGK